MDTFQKYFVDTLKNRYAQFDGRASRSEYWYFVLFYMIAYVALMILGAILGSISTGLAMIPTILLLVLALGVLVPSIALVVRRLHDTNKSGWMFLIAFIPVVGGIILLVFMCLESTPGPNEYGPNPHGDGSLSGAGKFDEIIDRG